MEEMTKDEFKTIMEMVRMIVEGSKDKDFNKYADCEVKRIESDEVTGVDTLYI